MNLSGAILTAIGVVLIAVGIVFHYKDKKDYAEYFIFGAGAILIGLKLA